MALRNYAPLHDNVMSHLATEIGRKAFLWAADAHDRSRMKYPAESYALEVDRLVMVLPPLIDAGGRPHGCWNDEKASDLLRFILKRHANWRFGGNVRMWWEAYR